MEIAEFRTAEEYRSGPNYVVDTTRPRYDVLRIKHERPDRLRPEGEAMTNMTSFQVFYDRDSDVLYMSTKQSAPAARGVPDALGIVWRYDSMGELIGATIWDFQYMWSTRHSELTRAVSTKFDIPENQTERVLGHAISQ